MLVATFDMLLKARQEKYAVGAFNVYNLEGALSVVAAATDLESPVFIQVLPSALEIGGSALIHLCLEAGRTSNVPIAVHLDHCSSNTSISMALNAGISSVMADGSAESFETNVNFTKKIVTLANGYHAGVEAELGRLSGSEDGLDAKDYQSRLTQPEQAKSFVEMTKICALAVCIGNIHGRYKNKPELDFDRLAAIEKQVNVPLVLHGTSCLPDELILKAIHYGVCKFNVNTEIRTTYLNTLTHLFKRPTTPELVEVIKKSIGSMKQPIKEKIRLFGSANKAGSYK